MTRPDRPAGAPLRRAMALVFLVAMAAAAVGIGVRATYGAHVAVDEVQYALTATSLIEDGDLDISDEWAEQRWRDFADEEPPTQTEVLAGGRQISPHDPLLPILLAVPTGLGGWIAAKLALAAMAGLLAALTLWLAVRRFRVDRRLAAVGVGLAFASAPLAVYGQQLYAELPAALAVIGGVAALTGTTRTRNLVLVAAAVTALPWLSIKYGLVAAAIAGIAAVRWLRAGQRREAAWYLAGLAAMGVAYLVIHRLVWGGWTVYASGDHFQESGEFGVIGFAPDYVGRSLRLVGLLADSDYGLVAWQPAWLLLVPAIAALAYRRPAGWIPLAVPLAAGWLVATFVALTMHGYWSPGRQLVVVLPLALLAILWWLDRMPPALRWLGCVLAVAGVTTYGWLLADGYARRLTWVWEFHEVGAPTYQGLRAILPDYRGESFFALHLIWGAALIALLVAGWRWAPAAAADPAPPPAAGRTVEPPAGPTAEPVGHTHETSGSEPALLPATQATAEPSSPEPNR